MKNIIITVVIYKIPVIKKRSDKRCFAAVAIKLFCSFRNDPIVLLTLVGIFLMCFFSLNWCLKSFPDAFEMRLARLD